MTAMLMGFVVRTIINGIALWVASLLVEGIRFGEEGGTWQTVWTITLVALIFGLVNAFVRPLAKLLSLPFIILTLGLFVFIVNALMLQLTSWISGLVGLDFTVESFFWDAILGALIITLVSMVLGFLAPDRD
jgi:putative membrane protein